MSFARLAPEQFDTIPGIAEPAENAALVGHEDAVAQIATAYKSGKLHHALLLAGPAGIGKATFAFRLAHHLLANPDPAHAPATFLPADPESSLFRQIAQGSHPGVLHLTRPVNEKTKGFKSVVTVDEIRRVSRFVSMTAHDGSYRIVIVDPADDMNTNAANALLKNLEEPPQRTLFVLITHSLGSLLPTIRSRCQLIRFKPLEAQSLLHVLEGLNAGLPDDPGQRGLLAERAGGSVREALLLTQFGGIDIADAVTEYLGSEKPDFRKAWRIAEAVSGRDSAVQFEIFNQMALDAIAGRAREAALEGDSGRADALSRLWNETERTIAETTTFNLDKKQHVTGLLRRMWQTLNP